MGDRDLLGPADVADDVLLEMTGAQVGAPVDRLCSCQVEEVAYDVPAITTAGRWWVRGTADTADGPTPYAFFVKLVQTWSRSPLFAEVPEEFREVAAASFPWRTEAAVYRSDLANRLPDGLRLPRVYRVHDVDHESYAVWLEAVPAVDTTWDEPRFERAARLLGRLAASRTVADLARVGDFPFVVAHYASTRFALQVEPILRSDIWQHPALAAFDADLRRRLLEAVDRIDDLVAEVDALPYLTAHGDACPNNLLVTDHDPDGFTVIDFGLWNAMPVGFDLGQLLVGETQVGRLPAERLGGIESAIVPAYVEGLRAEGCDVDEDTVRRAHAILLFVFAGASSVPFELLGPTPPPDLAAVAAERATVTRFSLDLLAQTQ